MDWRRLTYGLAGGGLVAVGLLSVAVVVLAVALAATTGEPAYLLGSPAPETTLGLVLVAATVVLGLIPVFAAGVGVYAQRYGAVGAVLGTLYALGGLGIAYQVAPTHLFTGVTTPFESTAWLLLLGGGALTWLALWPLSVAVGSFGYDDRRESGDGWLRRAGHAFQGPLFPFAVIAGVATGAWTAAKNPVGGETAFAVFAVTPFVAVLAVKLLDRDRAGDERTRAGDLSPTGRLLWTLGTRPLLAVSVGVLALLGVGVVASWLDLVSGPILGTGRGDRMTTARVDDQVYRQREYSPLITPTRLLGAALLPPLLGAVYVLTTVDDLLTDWRETVAGRRDEHADGLTDPAGVTFLDADDRVARVGPPRTARADHLLLGEDRVRVAEDARLDIVTREAESVGAVREFAADEPLAAREGDRVHVETADGEVEFTPYGDPDRLVAAVDRRYDAEVRTGRESRPRDRRDRPAADD